MYFVQSSGSGAGLGPLVNFYSRLPKGPAPTSVGGIKARFFNGKNASAAPLLAGILTIFGLGYTIDYQSAFASRFMMRMWISDADKTSWLAVWSASVLLVWLGTLVHLSE